MDDAAPVRAACWLCQGPAHLDEAYGRNDFYRCADCGFLFAPERSVEELHDLYTDSYFENYPGGESYTEDEEQRRFEAGHRLAWVGRHAPSGRLLEVGAANGAFLAEARSNGYTVVGVEPAAGLAARARERYGLDVTAGFIESVPLPPEPFDVVCAWHVLEHIREPHDALVRLRGAIRDTGRLFLEIPNIESIRARRHGNDWFHLDPANHVAFYTREQLAVVLAAAGFELLDTHTVSGVSYLRPALAVRPGALAVRGLDTVLTRARQGRPHPHKHEMLRAVARPR